MITIIGGWLFEAQASFASDTSPVSRGVIETPDSPDRVPTMKISKSTGVCEWFATRQAGPVPAGNYLPTSSSNGSKLTKMHDQIETRSRARLYRLTMIVIGEINSLSRRSRAKITSGHLRDLSFILVSVLEHGQSLVCCLQCAAAAKSSRAQTSDFDRLSGLSLLDWGWDWGIGLFLYS